MSDLIKSLVKIQSELNAPKNQYNSFGKYKYRSCEDILEGVKPLLSDAGLILFINDEIVQIGDRYYVKAIATVTNGESSQSASAFARESLDKKGMDSAQVTGATSSYARKYALNGLFCIDDSKDADTDEHRNQNATRKSTQSNGKLIAELQKQIELKGFTVQQVCETWGIKSLAEVQDLQQSINTVKGWQ